MQKCVVLKTPFSVVMHQSKRLTSCFLPLPWAAMGWRKQRNTTLYRHTRVKAHTLWQTRILLLRKSGLNQSSIPKYSTFSLSLSHSKREVGKLSSWPSGHSGKDKKAIPNDVMNAGRWFFISMRRFCGEDANGFMDLLPSCHDFTFTISPFWSAT